MVFERIVGTMKRWRHEKRPQQPYQVTLTVERTVWERLEERAREDSTTEAVVLVAALRRGMAYYWLYFLDDTREDAEYIEGLVKEYRKDHQRLQALEAQNRQLEQAVAKKLGRPDEAL